MQVIIVAHHSRMAWADQLRRALGAKHIVMDQGDNGAAAGHREALRIAATEPDRCIIIEDDAIPVEGFYDHAFDWFDRFPNDLISFYLGTSRPPQWQRTVDMCLRTAAPRDYIALPQLLHAVCYSIPQRHVAQVLRGLQLPEADFAIGNAWGRPILYPVESLVEHRDGVPVERHPDGQPRTEPRVARKLAGPLMYDR